MFLKFADVALNIPFQDRDSLTYIIPKSMEKNISVGVRVEVPLKARKVEGTVIEIHSSEPSYPVKEILKLVDKTPVVTEEQIELAFWMKDMYLASLGECLYKMVPGGRRKKNIKNLGVEVEANLLNLNSEQEIAFKNIYSCFGKESSHLLYGVTGSGKTEVYIHLIHKLLEETDKSAIYLVPEISLTVQTLRRLQIIFGDELAILHSALRISDRYNTYLQILKGEKRIVVGTRSAIFSPVQNLGLVIIDEEHDSSYKEHSSPRYHARQVAMQRCKTHSAVLLMGTATPSVELYYHATKGAVHLHVLKNRAKASSLSEITISENKDKKKILGDNLLFEVKKRLERQEQCILLLNRRGYSPLLYIKEQKKFLECPNCTANLCYHKKRTAICRVCGLSESLNDLKKDYG
ncbi:MAG: primosomal protein N', partial [Leptospiraceae bacterium]|nr:primosomal protein N' [Leptospiraceae bacterium]